MTRHQQILRSLAALAAAGLLLASCGDDDDTATTATTEATESTEADDAASSEYCEQARAMDEQSEMPTAEQVDALAEAAPEEIAEAADEVATAFGERGLEAFDDPAIADRFEELRAYDTEVCGIESGDLEVDPSEFAPGAEEYCRQTIALNNKASFPTDQELDALVAAAPEAIKPRVTEVAERFKELGAEAFEDDEFLAAIGEVETWETENCGIDYDDAEEGNTQEGDAEEGDAGGEG